MAYVSSSKIATTSVGARLAEMMKLASDAYGAWRQYHRTLAELETLSVRELDDLGLAGADLRRVAQDAVYGKAN
jgi:uncharacterized protein YjiS (DUF1127 family)